MSGPISHRGPHPHTVTRRAGPRSCRLATATATLTWALLASAVIVPAAWAENVIPPGGETPPARPVHVISGGMAGWQITLIALGAALVAAALAVRLDRALAARRQARRPAPHWPAQRVSTESGSGQDPDSAGAKDLVDFGWHPDRLDSFRTSRECAAVQGPDPRTAVAGSVRGESRRSQNSHAVALWPAAPHGGAWHRPGWAAPG
jgi:hypothetical protein